MAKERFERAMADWPFTKLLTDGGMHVFGKYETPGLANKILGFWLLVCIVLFFWILLSTENFAAAAVATGIAAIIYPGVVRPMMVNMLGKNVDVKIYPDKIQVRDGFRYRSYDRQMQIEFRLEEHQKGIEEHAREIKMQRPQKRIYREALEVVMQYEEKRVPLAEMPATAIEKGKALVIRLQNVCDRLDEAVRRMKAGQVRPAGEAPAGDFGPPPPIR
jgi:hypothetical protein